MVTLFVTSNDRGDFIRSLGSLNITWQTKFPKTFFQKKMSPLKKWHNKKGNINNHKEREAKKTMAVQPVLERKRHVHIYTEHTLDDSDMIGSEMLQTSIVWIYPRIPVAPFVGLVWVPKPPKKMWNMSSWWWFSQHPGGVVHPMLPFFASFVPLMVWVGGLGPGALDS